MLQTSVKIRKDGKYFVANSSEFPVVTQGTTKKSAIKNFFEALTLFGTDADARKRFPKLKQMFPETLPRAAQGVTLELIIEPMKIGREPQTMSCAYAPPSTNFRTTACPNFA